MEWSDEKIEKLRDMWELGYSALRANQETLPKIRGETLGRRLAAEQTRSLLDGLVRAGWLRLVTTKTGGRAVYKWRSTCCSFRGTKARKVGKVRKGAWHDPEYPFRPFLTFLTQRVRFPGPLRDSRHGLWSATKALGR